MSSLPTLIVVSAILSCAMVMFTNARYGQEEGGICDEGANIWNLPFIVLMLGGVKIPTLLAYRKTEHKMIEDSAIYGNQSAGEPDNLMNSLLLYLLKIFVELAALLALTLSHGAADWIWWFFVCQVACSFGCFALAQRHWNESHLAV